LKSERIDEAQYAKIADAAAESTIFHSIGFLKVLGHVIDHSELVCLGAFDEGKLLGAIPCFLKRTSLGNVLNSLPFQGSPGGCILAPNTRERSRQTKEVLLAAVLRLAEENDCISSTIISSPFDEGDAFYSEFLKPDFSVDRVAQVLELPSKDEDLMGLYTKSCRNSIRRAQKDGVKVEWDSETRSLDEVYEGQHLIMSSLGATPKPKSFFQAITEDLRSKDFRVYRATLSGKVAGLLLVLYYHGIAEYLVPVAPKEFRLHAPMNLIVHQVAKDAIESGHRVLSFGGTRPGMVDLYRFKSSFGTVDKPYHYFTKIHTDISALRTRSEAELGRVFEWFFLFPFAQLEGRTATS
jgi:GNAT acetyltransferase-like protein